MLAQAAPLAVLLQAPSSTGAISQVAMIALIFVIFYFFMIRPQQKKQKEAKSYLEALKKGDKVVTIGGLHGTITELSDLVVELEVARGVKMNFDRSAISMEGSKRIQAAEAK